MKEKQDNQSDKTYFDQAAASWEDNPVRIELAQAIADAITRRVPLSKEMQALEFGCGTGLVSMRIAESVGRIVAVDTSMGMLDVLERKIAENRIGNIQTRLMNLLDGAFPAERFDLVFSSMAMHHIKNVPHLLGIFNRLLNTGGYLAIADLYTEDGGFHGDIPDVFHYGFERSLFAEWMKKAGFSGILITTAHVMKKSNTHTGLPAEFPVFLAVGRKQDAA
ncbi:MAG: class I SAM-dependent methyltransferase [Desulfosalsimonadaceae bacterium]|nr:class I SAM-dependent methyltransferase [Desulfosalsimonadaceae bacterium]